MRTKDQILTDCRNDIVDEKYHEDQAHWLVLRQIEVLLDIRDILEADRLHIIHEDINKEGYVLNGG
ncbi:hypothetical protein ES703_37881 [subsurface metagenome]